MKSYSRTHVADHVLIRSLETRVVEDRASTAEMLADIAEIHARRLYAPAGYPSMFWYCVRKLHMSEDMACKRIRAARAARRFPAVFAALEDGRVHLTAVVMLAPNLNRANVDELIAEATHKSKRQLEGILAARFPKADVPTKLESIAPPQGAEMQSGSAEGMAALLARVPIGEPSIPSAPGRIAFQDSQQVAPPPAPSAPAPRATSVPHAKLAPLSAERYALQITIAQPTHDKLRYAQALLGHAVPSGDLAQVIDRALDQLIVMLEKAKFAAAVRTRPGKKSGDANPRCVPAEVRREVWQRDGGRCTFESPDGQQCETQERLEFDHVTPVARGGTATAANLRLRCRTHNQHAAEQAFGAGFMKAKREQVKRKPADKSVDATRQRQDTFERERAAAAEQGERNADVIPHLRRLGFRADEARHAAASCVAHADEPLAERVRQALRLLASVQTG
jgi:5-methylcytosine-specific restriction endonuclease McrA